MVDMVALHEDTAKALMASNIRRILAARGKSAYWLQRQMGLGQGSFYPIINGERMPAFLTVAKLCAILDTPMETLLEEPAPAPRKKT